MPSRVHQGLSKLLAESPRLIPVLVRRVFGLEVPESFQAHAAAETLREVDFPELAVDATVLVHDDEDPSQREAFAVEVQLRVDSDKRTSWPVYVAGLRRRLGCPVTLVVVTTSTRVARWCEQPIDLGRGRMIQHPLVIGPEQIPRTLDPEEAQRLPELAALAVIAHGRGTGSKRLSRTILDAIIALARHQDPRATLLIDLARAFLGQEALAALEDQMTVHRDMPVSDYFRRHYFKGAAAGLRQALEAVLQTRGLEVPEERHLRIEACTNAKTLDGWLRRAATAESLAEVFDD